MSISRRTMLKMAGACALQATENVHASMSLPADTYNDRAAMDKWIVKALKSPQAATNSLHLGRFADPTYFLMKDIGWTPNPDQKQYPSINAPVGFVTDFASIPRAFWSLLPPDGLYTYPAIVHDYLYWEQPVSREQADMIFKFAMQDFQVDELTIGAIHAGVRLGGGNAWNSNAALKKSGERRILKNFPSDPTMTWAKWKDNPMAFY